MIFIDSLITLGILLRFSQSDHRCLFKRRTDEKEKGRVVLDGELRVLLVICLYSKEHRITC